MRTSILLITGLVLFVVLSVWSVIHLKSGYDEQKRKLLDTLPTVPRAEETLRVAIQVTANGSISVGGKSVPSEALEDRLLSLKQQQRNLQVTLEIEETTPESAISLILNACASAGISDVSSTRRPLTDAP